MQPLAFSSCDGYRLARPTLSLLLSYSFLKAMLTRSPDNGACLGPEFRHKKEARSLVLSIFL